MNKEDYQKLIEANLKLRLAENALAEALELLRVVNKGILKDLLLKEAKDA